jgi:di/tricarboxylate transporter
MRAFTVKKTILVLLSAVVPALIVVFRPLGASLNQAAVIAALLLALVWWTTGIVRVIPASIFLMLIFALASGLPLKTVFAFPLSESFALIALCYLFSYGIAKSGLVEKLVKPVLARFAKTPVSIIVSMLVLFTASIYLIPQPLARLVIVAGLFDTFFRDSGIPDESREALNLACVLSYTFVCMTFKSADMVLNTAVLAFANVSMGELEWIRYASVPTFLTSLLVWALFAILFRKQLRHIRIGADAAGQWRQKTSRGSREKAVLGIALLAVAFWMTSPLHGISPAIIALAATALLFVIRALELRDLLKIDVATLIFLSAAFSTGGVLKGSGAANLVFSRLGAILPDRYSPLYIAGMALIAMLTHMLLGSNTTTCSVVIPGLIAISGHALPPAIIGFIVYYSMIYHVILPVHSVSFMVCAGSGYFSPKPVLRLGIPVTLVVFISILCIYTPWWILMGLL